MTQRLSMSYTKLHKVLLTSSVWEEPSDIRVVWITLLAMANQDGLVESSLLGLRRMANVPMEVVERALDIFLNEDTYSRTTTDGGCRLKVVPGGWFVINYQLYRDRASRVETLRRHAVRQQRYRDKKKLNEDAPGDGSVTLGDASDAIGEGEGEGEGEAKEPSLVLPAEAKPKKPRRRKCQIPGNWKPNQAHQARAESIGLNADQEKLMFREHAIATGRLLVDWNAGFSMWLRKAAEFKSGGKQSAAPRQVRPDAPRGGWYAKHKAEREKAALEASKTPGDPGPQYGVKAPKNLQSGPAIATPVPADDDEIPF